MDKPASGYPTGSNDSNGVAAYVPPASRTPEQAAAILAAERAIAEKAHAASKCAIGNSPDDVQMVIAYVASGACEPLTEFCREWRKAKGAADQARINARPKPR